MHSWVRGIVTGQAQRGFEDLDCYQLALQVLKEAYKGANQRSLCHRALQSLNGYIRYTQRQRQGQKEFGDRVLREPEVRYVVQPESTNPESADPDLTNPESTNLEL